MWEFFSKQNFSSYFLASGGMFSGAQGEEGRSALHVSPVHILPTLSQQGKGERGFKGGKEEGGSENICLQNISAREKENKSR